MEIFLLAPAPSSLLTNLHPHLPRAFSLSASRKPGLRKQFTSSNTKIKTVSPNHAARLFSIQCPSEYPSIAVEWGFADYEVFPNKQAELIERRREQAERKQREDAERKQQKDAARLELLQKLLTSVETNEGNLSGLSYVEINALVENMQEFPGLAESLNPKEYAVREKLYKVAFFDRNLQAGSQAQEQAKEAAVQTELLNKLNIAVGNKPSSGAAKGSNAAKNAAMLGGAAALMKLNQISEDTSEISEGFGGF